MIAIVILNWNGKQMLRQFLPSVVAHSAGEGEVIVADNGSDDGSAEMLREEFPTVRLLCLEQNFGFAEGYNVAFERLRQLMGRGETPRYDYYLLLNSDVETTPGWLVPLPRGDKAVSTMSQPASIAFKFTISPVPAVLCVCKCTMVSGLSSFLRRETNSYAVYGKSRFAISLMQIMSAPISSSCFARSTK